MIEFLLKNIMKFHSELDASKGIRDMGLIESAVHTPFQSFGGQDFYPTTFDKAARLFFGLAKNHGFVDDNKRVALHATELFLHLNGYLMICSQSDRIDVTMKIAKSEMSVDIIKNWLINNCLSVRVHFSISVTKRKD